MKHHMIEVSGLLQAPLRTVTDLALAARAGPIGPGNAWLLLNLGWPSGATLTGGPHTLTATAGGHNIAVELGPARSLALQGGWWYRGEYTFDPDPRGTRLTHRVYNVATRARWAVPLANRFFIGFDDATRRAFADLLHRISEQLECAALLEHEPRTTTARWNKRL